MKNTFFLLLLSIFLVYSNSNIIENKESNILYENKIFNENTKETVYDKATDNSLGDREVYTNYVNGSFDSIEMRRLQAMSNTNQRRIQKGQIKAEKLRKLVTMIESLPIPSSFVPQTWCKPHNRNGPAIFAAAMSPSLRRYDANFFVGTARKTGYKGDIVIAVLPETGEAFEKALRDYDAIAYTVKPNCVGTAHDQLCSFDGQAEGFSINMIRYHLYQWWATKYSNDALIMISDFRDVFFQSNPFNYRAFDWHPPVSQLVVFQEAYPNKVIYRCPFNGGWIQGCYGMENFKKVSSNTVSCSGVSIGTRDAIMAYAYLIILQLDPRVRYGRNTTITSNKGCVSLGMDQGLHNWLLYSGALDRYMDVKIYQQGEGPVNTVGAFFGERAILKFSLEQWKVLRGVAPDKYFYNWNGDISPVIHQSDRFQETEFKHQYDKHLAVMKDLHTA